LLKVTYNKGGERIRPDKLRYRWRIECQAASLKTWQNDLNAEYPMAMAA